VLERWNGKKVEVTTTCGRKEADTCPRQRGSNAAGDIAVARQVQPAAHIRAVTRAGNGNARVRPAVVKKI